MYDFTKKGVSDMAASLNTEWGEIWDGIGDGGRDHIEIVIDGKAIQVPVCADNCNALVYLLKDMLISEKTGEATIGNTRAAYDEQEVKFNSLEQGEDKKADFLSGEGDAYAVYHFDCQQNSVPFESKNYNISVTGPLEPGDTLDTIHEKHKVKAGDVIVMRQDGEIMPWYVDYLAFSKLPQFFGSEVRAGMPLSPAESARNSADIQKPSVLDRIREAANTPKEPKTDKPSRKKSEPEL